MVLNTTIFLATDLINYSKEDIAVGFFRFCYYIFYLLYANGEKVHKDG